MAKRQKDPDEVEQALALIDTLKASSTELSPGRAKKLSERLDQLLVEVRACGATLDKLAERPARQALAEISRLTDQIAQDAGILSVTQARKARQAIVDAVSGLDEIRAKLDPIREPPGIFDPASPSLVGSFVGVGLIAQERVPLDSVNAFYGSGVYAIYYNGPHPDYQPLVGTQHPIYVGKADPESAVARRPQEQGTGLYKRLNNDHARSIRKATTTLAISDFSCRFLVVQSGWQTAAEDYLISLFTPIWNDETNICWGLGKHGDAAETRGNKRSPWDTMHPGRMWAGNEILEDSKPIPTIQSELAAHFVANPPFKETEDILKRFYAALKQS